MPRIRAENVPAHRALVRTELLDAFGELMGEVGYAGLTLAQVAARAGVARNTVYGYVADKEALLMAYVERSVEVFLADVRREMATAPDAAGRLAVLVRRQMHQFRQEPGAGTETGMLDGATLPPASHGALMSRFRPLHGLLAEVIGDGVATGELRAVDVDAVVPMAFAVMGAERMPVGRGDTDPDDAADRVTDFLLHALGAARPQG
jgi:AcrR family transcriptional regulator